MENFSLSRDYKAVIWGDTLSYNFLRGASAGLIIGFIIAMNSPPPSNSEIGVLAIPMITVAYMFFMPLVLMLFFIPYTFVISLLDRIPGGGGLFFLRILSFVFSLIPAIGDPLLKVLKSYFPKLVPVENPGWFHAKVIIFVLR